MSNKSNGSTKKSSVSRIPFLSKRRNTAVGANPTTTSTQPTTQPTNQTQNTGQQQPTSTAPTTQNPGSNPNDLLSGALSNMKLNRKSIPLHLSVPLVICVHLIRFIAN